MMFNKGQYKLNFFYDNVPILNAPIIALTTGYSLINEVKVYGAGICRSTLNEESEFFVDCNNFVDLESYPEVTFTGFSTDLHQLNIKMESVSKGLFRCSYVAETPGRVSTV
jgi:hypothetical protein